MQNLSFTEKLGERLFPSLRERRKDLERALDVDRQTQLANRAAFDKARLSAEFDPAMMFIALDCNNFKLVNDEFGHLTGDALLWQIASEIKLACFNFKARAFRVGGDEFVVLVKGRFAERLRDSIERRVKNNEETRRLNGRLASFSNKQISISGTIGATYDEADALLQTRKANMKKF